MIYLVKTKLEGKLMQKGHNLETMLRILKGFMTDMETDLSAFLESDNLQDAKAIADIANESISETITLFKAIRNMQVSLRSCSCTTSSIPVKGWGIFQRKNEKSTFRCSEKKNLIEKGCLF